MTLGRMVQRSQGGAQRAGDIRASIRPSGISRHKPRCYSDTRPRKALVSERWLLATRVRCLEP